MLMIETLNRTEAKNHIKTMCEENGWDYTIEHDEADVILTFIIDRHGANRDIHFDRKYYWLLDYYEHGRV